MARHGYVDEGDLDQNGMAMWRGRVASAIRGKRGQAMLRDLAAALDSMPDKRLVAGELQTKEGDCCAIGRVCQVRGINYVQEGEFDPYVQEDLNDDAADKLNVAKCLIQEVEWINDEAAPSDPEKRWAYVRRWVDRQLTPGLEGK